MKRVWQTSAAVLGGLLVAAISAMPQAYTVSAKPGAVNYIEGHAFLNGQPLSDKGLRSTFLNANDTLSTDLGKAEILLTPGVFLRIGDNSEIRMVSPSLTDTQVELKKGKAMIEADGLTKENRIQVNDHGATITLQKNGLYRFTADENPTAAVLDGKAQIYFGEQKIDLGKGRQTLLSENLKAEKFDTKKDDALYAWSNTRAQYDAASSYHAAQSVSANGYAGGYGFDPAFGYGIGPWYGPGWYWNSAFNGWGWIPGNGAFYSPFGWGFYGLAYLPYAPVVAVPVAGGYRTGKTVAVPVNANNPPAIGKVSSSPAANQAARSQVAHSAAAAGGFRTASGAPAPTFSGNRIAAPAAAAGRSAAPSSMGHTAGSAPAGHSAPAGPAKH